MIKLSGPSRIITGDETLKVFREGSSIPEDVYYKDGKPIKREEECFEITCNVQPLDGKDLDMVPEGDRDTEMYHLFCNNQQKPLRLGDRVVRDGYSFHVQNVEQWGSFMRARIAQIDVGPFKP